MAEQKIKLSKWQMVDLKSQKVGGNGLTMDNHLGTLLMNEPNRATEKIVEMFAYQRGKTLLSEFYKLPVKYFDNYNEIVWDLIGSARRNIPLLEARNEKGNVVTAASGMVGVSKAPFELVFAENYFGEQEIIVGNLNERYQFRIISERPRMEGTNYVYKVQLFGNNTEGIPAERLLAGERFSYMTAFVERELSRKAGTVNFSTTTNMRNDWSSIRIYDRASGSELDRKFAIAVPITKQHEGDNIKGKTTNMWMSWREYEMEQKWREYIANAILFGRSNADENNEVHDFGRSGNEIRTGAGLYEQMEAGNTHYYSQFSLRRLTNALTDLFCGTGNVAPNNRHVTLVTGTYGAMQFSEAVQKEVLGWQVFDFNASDLNIVGKAASNNWSGSTPSLKAGFQFTEYMAPGGIHVSVMVDPAYDDPVWHGKIKINGAPAFSYRYDIFDLSPDNNGETNVFLCKVKGQEELHGYKFGFRNPWTGQRNNDYMSTEIDEAQFHKFCPAIGVCVLDPTRTMSFIPTVLQG